MEVSVSGQIYAFWAMLAGGAASGLLSDVFMLLRLQMGRKRFTTGLADLALWAVLAAGIFLLNLHVNNGELRWYSFCGLFLGALLYFLMLSRVMRLILGWIFGILKKILCLILKIVLTIAAFLYKIICGIFSFIARLFAPLGIAARRAGAGAKRGLHGMRLVLKKK